MIRRLRVLFDNFSLAPWCGLPRCLPPARRRRQPDGLAIAAVALVFFLRGAKLSREAVIAGATHWRLHAAVLACTFFMVPVPGLLFKPALQPLAWPRACPWRRSCSAPAPSAS